MFIRILGFGRGIEEERKSRLQDRRMWKWHKMIAKELEECIACSIST